jgi:hypothetical protein
MLDVINNHEYIPGANPKSQKKISSRALPDLSFFDKKANAAIRKWYKKNKSHGLKSTKYLAEIDKSAPPKFVAKARSKNKALSLMW